MVFPAAHINSPASMFGHTFLRIDSAYESKLLSHAINYAATADMATENGIIFAIKGLFGGYSGVYSMLPYYEKLKEYRDSDQRDIFEYNLNLSEEEVHTIILHIWELKDAYSWYYFFDENCSYNMLWLLEIARDGVALREQFFHQVIPIETIFAIEDAQLVASKAYRPSLRTKLLKYEALLGYRNSKLAYELAYGRLKPSDIEQAQQINAQEKSYIFEVTALYLEYLHIEAKISSEAYKKRFHNTNVARAKLGKQKEVTYKTPYNPDKSHRSRRIELASGSYNGYLQNALGFRLTYHSLDDSPNGLLDGTEIKFADLLAIYSEDELFLEKATLLSITSISPISQFIEPISWRTSFGFDRDTRDNALIFQGSVGAGVALGTSYFNTYLFSDLFSYFDTLDKSGVSVSAGLIINESEHFRTTLEVKERLFSDGGFQNLIKFNQLYSINEYVALKLQYDYTQQYHVDKNVARFVLNLYY